MLLSDGEYSHSCMLATQLAELVHTNQLKDNSVVLLNDYICNQMANKKCGWGLGVGRGGHPGRRAVLARHVPPPPLRCVSRCAARALPRRTAVPLLCLAHPRPCFPTLQDRHRAEPDGAAGGCS